MQRSTILLLVLVQIFAHVRAEGKYTIIAPGTIHSEGTYTAAVSVHHVSQPCQIKVGITGPSFNETQTVEVADNEIKNVDFNFPVLEKGFYNLTAEGINCMNDFKNTTRLSYQLAENTVHIQTDKGLYKPGDEMNYRVLFLDKDLKPGQAPEDAFIYIEDAKVNRIKEIHDFVVTKGVYTGKFKIPEFPAEGGWKLAVKAKDQRLVYVNFKVEKYVLPKYVVKAEATKVMSIKDGDIQVVVNANYTYGKPLNGKVTVFLTLIRDWNVYTSHMEDEKEGDHNSIIRKADMIQGKAKIDINIKELEAYMRKDGYNTRAGITVTVEEEFTGVKINATAATSVYPYRFSMECVHYTSCSDFEADKERELLIRFSHVDGSFVNDTKNPVELTFTNAYEIRQFKIKEQKPSDSETQTFTFQSYMNETGFANFKVVLPELKEYESHWHTYQMDGHYRDEKRKIQNIRQKRKPKQLVQVENKEPKHEEPKEYFILRNEHSHYSNRVKLNEPETFTLNSSQPLSYFTYNVIGHGNILKSGRIELSDKPKVYNFTLTPEFLWAPRFSVYVYYVDDEGQYHYAELNCHMTYELQNYINITAAAEVKPGDEVALKIKTAPNSFVGLMAVDQSVLLLKKNNDLDYNSFKWILGSYNTYTLYQGGYSHYPGSRVGCVTLTNADYFYNWTMPEHSYGRQPLSGVEYYHDLLPLDGMPMATARTGGYAARPYSTSAGPYSAGDGDSSVQLRKDFSETWLFANIENTETEEFTWSKNIPDTITSWVLTGFSMNNDVGVAVTRDPTKIITFKPFFISVRLPYSVKRGEVINVPALVFNYLDHDLDVEVTLDNADGEFEFTEIDNKLIADEKRTKAVRVPANGAAGVAFMIRPKVLGNILLKYTAISPVAGDAIHKPMKVVPEGITQYGNRAYFVNLNEVTEEKSSFTLELPEDVVPGSQHIEVGVVGDILGPVLNNLDNLVRLPRGCGEQTMSAIIPNYMVMKYLKNFNSLTASMETKLRYNMESGYQNMLNYRHTDGSFSSFGPSTDEEHPRNGSVWLTAYVTRSLQKLTEFVHVDQDIVEKALEYMVKQQAANGSFLAHGDYFYASQANHVSLTSTVMLAFIQNQTIATKYSKEIEKGLTYIAQNEDKNDSLHAQVLAAYTLDQAKHSAAKEKLLKLKSLAKTDADRVWWSPKERPAQRRWWFYVYSRDVEITSYVLLTLLNQPTTTVDDVFPIIRWLVAQRNSHGGFSSSQDTVIGLQALMQFAKLADYQPAKMEVDISSTGGHHEKKETVKLTEDNGILYQNFEMPEQTETIEFSAKGTGTAMVQIAYQYNIFEKNPQPSFTISTTKFENIEKTALLNMEICVEYVGDDKASNMAILEINTPSGYIVDEESLDVVKTLERVSFTELKNADSLVVVYFDHLYKNDKTCFLFEALRTHPVAMQKPASMVLYDYYDTNKKVTEFYGVDSKLCDICEGEEECSKCK